MQLSLQIKLVSYSGKESYHFERHFKYSFGKSSVSKKKKEPLTVVGRSVSTNSPNNGNQGC